MSSRDTCSWHAAPSSAESTICSATASKPCGLRQERVAHGSATLAGAYEAPPRAR